MRTAALPVPHELRALFAYETLPPGCLAVPVVEDWLAPHLRSGEFAIVDPAECEPLDGELFLVAWMGRLGPDGRERTALCQAHWRPSNTPDGRDQSAWWVGSMRRNRTREQVDRLIKAGRLDALGWSNGPYGDGVLEQQIRGRVVGVLVTAFEEPRRLPRIAGGAA